jgi:hypothetical protein
VRWTFWLYAVPALTAALCLVFYGLRSPWWRSWTGRAQATLYAALLAVLALAALLRVLRLPYGWAVFLSVAAMGCVQVALLIHLLNIVRLQHRDRKERS